MINDVDRSIRNLTRIGSQGMNETDKLVLDIMTRKQCEVKGIYKDKKS